MCNTYSLFLLLYETIPMEDNSYIPQSAHRGFLKPKAERKPSVNHIQSIFIHTILDLPIYTKVRNYSHGSWPWYLTRSDLHYNFTCWKSEWTPSVNDTECLLYLYTISVCYQCFSQPRHKLYSMRCDVHRRFHEAKVCLSVCVSECLYRCMSINLSTWTYVVWTIT